MELLTRIQIASLLGITKSDLNNRIRKFYIDFPKPVKKQPQFKAYFYDKDVMVDYFKQHPYTLKKGKKRLKQDQIVPNNYIKPLDFLSGKYDPIDKRIASSMKIMVARQRNPITQTISIQGEW